MSKSHGRGRPSKFQGAMAKVIVGVLKASGLTGGKAALAELGQSLQGVSLPTLAKLASDAGVTFTKGRKAGATATVEEKPAKSKKSKKRGPGRPKGSTNKAKAKRGPGRPKGSKNKVNVIVGKKRGRPLGSKNKAKAPEVAPVIQDQVVTPVVEAAPVVTPVVTETPVVEAAPVVTETAPVETAPETPVVAEATTETMPQQSEGEQQAA